MASFSPISVTPALMQAQGAQPTAAEMAKRHDIKKAAQDFEASFLSIMLQPMFEGTDPQAPFSGGPGEQAFKSFMTDALAKQMTQHGGIGLTDVVGKEMLKLQGLE